MANLLLLLACFLVGFLARRSKALPADSHKPVNAWVLYVSLPALTFRAIHGVRLEWAMFLEALLLWLVFLGPAAVAWVAARRGGDRGPLGALALCAGLSNTAFVGLPLLEALGGKEVLGAASVVDQLGSFTALFFLAIPFATAMGGREVSLARSVKKLVRSPVIFALVLAVALQGVVVPAEVDAVLARLADMLSPLALASIGWQVELSALRGSGARVALGLGWKLVLAPALVLGVLLLWRGALGPFERVVVAQAAMAPMVTAGVVAAEHELSPGLAAALITVGVPLSLVTVPLWWWLLLHC